MSKILAIMGPSGVGKTTIQAALQQIAQGYVVIPAWTTRPPRDDDVDRIHVSDEEFDAAYSDTRFLPLNNIYGARYATPRKPIWQALARGDFPLLNWPLELAPDLRAAFPGQVMAVYLRPPSIAELRRRLSYDDRDDDGSRFVRALAELSREDLYGTIGPVDLIIDSECGNEGAVARKIHTTYLRSLQCHGINTDIRR